jgi:hypothetical protein
LAATQIEQFDDDLLVPIDSLTPSIIVKPIGWEDRESCASSRNSRGLIIRWHWKYSDSSTFSHRLYYRAEENNQFVTEITVTVFAFVGITH